MPTKRIESSERRRCVKACDSCQRRKQRCDGEQPCRRCKLRRVEDECFFPTIDHATKSVLRVATQDWQDANAVDLTFDCPRASRVASIQPRSSFFPSDILLGLNGRPITGILSPVTIPRPPSMLQNSQKAPTFIRDTSHLSLLQHIQRFVRLSRGSCAFVDSPLNHAVLEDVVDQSPHWLYATTCPQKPSLIEATAYVRQFIWSTNCILDLFDEVNLVRKLPAWIQGKQNDELDMVAIFYLVVAIGMQAAPEGSEDMSRSYFQYGRHLTAFQLSMGPSVQNIQCDVLITWYLLAASQKNAAYVHLGTAIRAAYTLGLFKGVEAVLCESNEDHTRERLWKSIRVLDGFLSLVLGRPSLIHIERDDLQLLGQYSAVIDLCIIFETVQNLVCAKTAISLDVVQQVGTQHRRWSDEFCKGLDIDCIKSANTIEMNGKQQPNLGLFHLLEGYYWTIILLTLPFLTEFVSNHIMEGQNGVLGGAKEKLNNTPYRLVVHACIDSAVNTLEMLQGLMSGGPLPKRMPFVVNSVFISALTIGFAIFGDLDHDWDLNRYLSTAKVLLLYLGVYDPVAQEQSLIVENLQLACDAYLNSRSHQSVDLRTEQLGDIFGNVKLRSTTNQPTLIFASGLQSDAGVVAPPDCVNVDSLPFIAHNTNINTHNAALSQETAWLPATSHGSAESEMQDSLASTVDYLNIDSTAMAHFSSDFSFEHINDDYSTNVYSDIHGFELNKQQESPFLAS